MRTLLLILLFSISTSNANAQSSSWIVRAEGRFMNSFYQVQTRTPKNLFPSEAKIVEVDFFGNLIAEYPLHATIELGRLEGEFKFLEFKTKRLLSYSFKHHNSTGVFEIFDVEDRNGEALLQVHIESLEVDHPLFPMLPLETQRLFHSTPELPLLDTTRLDIMSFGSNIIWQLTEHGNITATITAIDKYYLTYKPYQFVWTRDFRKEFLVKEELENKTILFQGPYSNSPGKIIPPTIGDHSSIPLAMTLNEITEAGEWKTVFTEILDPNTSFRIRYLEDTIVNCHICPAEVRAQLIDERSKRVYREIPINVATSWGKPYSTFQTHRYGDKFLLSYESTYGNNGNATSTLQFFNMKKLGSEPIAEFNYDTSVEGGCDWNELPKKVQSELIECTPYQIDTTNAYIHAATRFEPDFTLNENGDVVLNYLSSRRSFEPISYSTCREFLEYTLPNKTIILAGPLSDQPGAVLKSSYGAIKETGFDLDESDGGRHFNNIPEYSKQ